MLEKYVFLLPKSLPLTFSTVLVVKSESVLSNAFKTIFWPNLH